MRVQVYSRWSINRLNLRERERNRERGMIEARRSRKRATWPIPPGAEWMEGEGWKERGCEPARHKGKHTSAGRKVGGRLERGCSDVRMTQCCNLPTSSSRILLALRLTLTLAEHRSVSSNEVSGERLARGSPVCLPFASRLRDWSEVIGVIYLPPFPLKRERDRSYPCLNPDRDVETTDW